MSTRRPLKDVTAAGPKETAGPPDPPAGPGESFPPEFRGLPADLFARIEASVT